MSRDDDFVDSPSALALAEKRLTQAALKSAERVRNELLQVTEWNPEFKTYYYGHRSITDAEALKWILYEYQRLYQDNKTTNSKSTHVQ